MMADRQVLRHEILADGDERQKMLVAAGESLRVASMLPPHLRRLHKLQMRQVRKQRQLSQRRSA